MIYKIHTKKEITTSEAMTARLLQALALSRFWMEFAATLFSNSRWIQSVTWPAADQGSPQQVAGNCHMKKCIFVNKIVPGSTWQHPHRWPGTINTDQHCRSPTTAIACAAMRMAAGEGDALKFNSSSIASHQNPILTSFHWTRMLPMYSIDINFVHLPSSHLIEWTYSKSPTFEPILHLGHRVFDWKLGAPTVERVQHEPPGRYLASLAWLPKWPIPPLMLWPLLSAPSSQARLSPATQSRGGLFKCNNTLLEWFEFWKRMKMETTNSEIQSVVSLSQSSQQLHHKESR